MKLDKIEAMSRTIAMVADFAHRDSAGIRASTALRGKTLHFTDEDLAVLEVWIEGPISKTRQGYFQEFGTDVRTDDLLKPETKTVGDLSDLIWSDTPTANRV